MRVTSLGLCLFAVAGCSSDVNPAVVRDAGEHQAHAVGAATSPRVEHRLKRVGWAPGVVFGQGMHAKELKLMAGGRWVVVRSWAHGKDEPMSAALVNVKTGEVEHVEQWVSLAPDLSSGVYRAQGKLWFLDARASTRSELRATLSRDLRSENHEGLPDDFNYGRAVSYSPAGDLMSVILPGDDAVELHRVGAGVVQTIEAPEGTLIWRAEPTYDGSLRLWTVEDRDYFELNAGPRDPKARKKRQRYCTEESRRQNDYRRVLSTAWRWDGERWDDQSMSELWWYESMRFGTSPRVTQLAGGRLFYDEDNSYYQNSDGAFVSVIEGCSSSWPAFPATRGLFAIAACESRNYLYDLARERAYDLSPSIIPLVYSSYPYARVDANGTRASRLNPRYGVDASGAQWAAVLKESQSQRYKMLALGRLRLSDAKVEWLVQDLAVDTTQLYDYWYDAPSWDGALTSQELALVDYSSGQVLRASRAELGDAKHIVLIPTLGGYAISDKPVLAQTANGCVLVHDTSPAVAVSEGYGPGPWQVRCPAL